ncbi:CBS domain-containing protein [Solilutibacter silvestris]|uniref:CBS domain-containing protein n=1 Tax=Solilutibacter silvestris TaxID=1645665 RepID=A0A2K1Q252_9GAMM|nr:CBS domain-containing protein [Lysobacter silvestris]PNS09112.1 CBS domain-containing protein [Lysobacter silvestris]
MNDVSTVMTSNPVGCKLHTPVRDVAKLMLENDCGQIPVLDDVGAPIGVVTDRDIALRVVARGGDPMTQASAIMTTPVKAVHVDSDLKECLALMENAQIRRVPVIDGAGKLVGMVAVADIARACKDQPTASVVKEVSQPPAKAAH